MIDLVLNNLGLSLKDRTSILMIRDLWRIPVIEVAANGIRNKVERVAFSVMTLVMESSQGLNPWIDRSEGLLHSMARS